MRRIALLLTVVVSCSFAACEKGDKKASTSASASAAPKAEEGKPAAAATGGATVTIADAADYEAKAIAFTEKMMQIFSEGGTNCDKVAADLTTFFGAGGKATAEALAAFEKANPDARTALDTKTKPREAELEAKLGPTMEACRDHEGIKAAMGGLEKL